MDKLTFLEEHMCLSIGANLQSIFLDLGFFLKEFQKGKVADRESVAETTELIDRIYLEFNCCYIKGLPDNKSILASEQRTWKAISPEVNRYLKNSESYLNQYGQSQNNRERFASFIVEGFKIFSYLNTISTSYRSKFNF